MDEHDLKAIEERLEKVTPGPWCERALFYILRHARKSSGSWDDEESGSYPDEGSSAFISHAPTDIRALLDEVRMLKAELEHERLRLAACGVAALGYTNDAGGAESASFDEVVRLRARAEKAEAERDAAVDALRLAGGTINEAQKRIWGAKGDVEKAEVHIEFARAALANLEGGRNA